MRRSVGLTVALVGLLAAPLGAQQASSPEPAAALISRALEHENAGRYSEARAAWRAVLDAGAVGPGIFGLERVYQMTGDELEFLPLIDSILRSQPADTPLRGAQLRTLVALGQHADADTAFAAWRDLRPGDVAPYRDYARILLFNNRPNSADSVLEAASRALRDTRGLLLESAQMRAALGRWSAAAEAWRETMRDNAYYESGAVFSLSPTPDSARDGVRGVLAAEGAPIGARQVLSFLELAWGSPRRGWEALASMPPSDTTLAVWRLFAEEAERAQAWGAVQLAWTAAFRMRPAPEFAERAAVAALNANDPESALRLAQSARRPGVPVRPEVLGVELEAYARMGRGADAERALAAAAPSLGEPVVRGFQRTIAWAWIRAGEVERARAAIAEAPLDAEDAVSGWLALFDGNLAEARRALRFGNVSAPETVQALALLSRTTADRSGELGAAFLALARSDSARAAGYLEQAAAQLPDAASLLMTMAARIETRRGGGTRAETLWRRVAADYAQTPEAPEARLELARLLRRRGDLRAARAEYEELIITYPTSALVPQARRELDSLNGARPGGR